MKYSLCTGLLLLLTTSIKAPKSNIPLFSSTEKLAPLEQKKQKKDFSLSEGNRVKTLKKYRNRFGIIPLISTTFLHSGLRYKLWSDRTITRRNISSNNVTHVFHPRDKEYKEVYKNIPEFSEK